LWTAIAFLQRTEPDVVSVIYSGDIDATKDQILEKVKVRLQQGLLGTRVECRIRPGLISNWRHHLFTSYSYVRGIWLKNQRGQGSRFSVKV
jgi:ALG11 mannosyltransferase N-terminus